ncbi:alpha/beta hydrolase [Kribbella sp. NBC_01245]|uniref:alpha/beta fold hydrolase n=1 Tax=Kribbella sp. NBC_01245 TaxID=2903578 RepID=UPI002E2A1894|nr:alpha/beta hydrolase [Kribbella sp. NBC_01245]
MSAKATVTVDGVNGVEIAYERTGSGEPLVLMHGIGHHRQAWDPVIDRLAVERDVIAIDFPGFGESPDVPTGIADEVSVYVRAMTAFFEAVDLDRPHVAGNSMGGLISLLLGQAGVVQSVTALSPAGLWTSGQRARALTILNTMRQAARRTPPIAVARLARSRAGRRAMTGMIYHRPALREPAAVIAETAALANAPAFDRVLALGRSGVVFEGDVPEVPVTIAWGTHDRILQPRQTARARQQIPAARMVSLPACGHVPMNDSPDLVARVLLEGSSPG